MPPENGDISGQLRPLADNNIPYLVIHKRFLSPQQVSEWRRWMGIAPRHEDDELLVYPTALEAGETSAFWKRPCLAYLLWRGALPQSIGLGDPVSGVSHWSLDQRSARSWTACYELVDAAGTVVEDPCHAG